MSWMFDRLCEIAVADRVEVVIAADVDHRSLAPDVSDLAEVLARAVSVPQLTFTLMRSGTSPRAALGAKLFAVDLEDLTPGAAADATATAIRGHCDRAATALSIRGTGIALYETTAESAEVTEVTDRAFERTANDHAWPPAAAAGSRSDADGGCRTVVATDARGRTEQLRAAGRTGIGIAIGGVDPEAQVRVDTFLGAVSILDALVTLRAFAFGGDRGRVVHAPVTRWPGVIDRLAPPAVRRVV